ncbi:SPOR domain-containing protein [Methylophaga sp.]|uniref:SPOR domain-containing protein n=1 Tax=Methylophaga sp. TaxID=2024840 RepID=UPI003F69EE7A
MTLIQQQRLIGAILLVCLIGVIAWFLLDTVEQSQPEKMVEEPISFDSVIEPIPDDIEIVEPADETLVDPQSLGKPNTETELELNKSESNLELPTQPEPKPESPPVQSPQIESESKPATQPETTPQPAADTSQERWVLQLGSFSEKQNADALAGRVKALGHDPMIETTSNAGTVIYRVRLQPVTDRNQLEKTAQTLNKKLGLSTQIQHYVP